MPGPAAAKILSLTRQYVRVHMGVRQNVRQYPTPHPAQLKPNPWGKMPRVKIAWKHVQVGTVVDFGGEPWKVVKTHIFNRSGTPNTKGTSSGVSTGSGTSTGSGASTGSGTGTGSKVPGAASPPAPITDRLKSLRTGREIDITLTPGFKIWVY